MWADEVIKRHILPETSKTRPGLQGGTRRAPPSEPVAPTCFVATRPLRIADAGTVEGGGRVSFDIGRLALVAIAVALWVAVFRGFNAF
jgi:hypothetical protein